MAQIIEFRTREPRPVAVFEILPAPDRTSSLVLVDGLVPLPLAREMAALCEAYRNSVTP